MNNIKRIAVVGAGSAGLIAAMILKQKYQEMQIDIICSSEVGIIGVGEGATEHWRDFADFVRIDPWDLIRETDATFKLGIMFRGWSNKDYQHTVQQDYSLKHITYPIMYARQISYINKPENMSSSLYWNNFLEVDVLKEKGQHFSNQYHFNAFKLNDFLIRHAKKMGIKFYDDLIENVTLNEIGEIDKLTGKSGTIYDYDFYVDSTGFRKVLISKLGAKWKSYGKYLKAKAAMVFPTEESDAYNMWTLSEARDYGWLFRTPVWGRNGNGYIFDTDYITPEQAKQELDNLFDKDVKIVGNFKFDPGHLDKMWIKNCCAIGLSSMFVEPLESSAIGSAINQSFLLMQRLINYNDKIINSYNKSMTDMTENIRDYIALHYVTKKTNTQFWRDAGKDLPDSLKDRLEIWTHKMPVREDFKSLTEYIMFTESNFILVMQGLGLFNVDSIRKEYESISKEARQHVEILAEHTINYESTVDRISHKDAIAYIRYVSEHKHLKNNPELNLTTKFVSA